MVVQFALLNKKALKKALKKVLLEIPSSLTTCILVNKSKSLAYKEQLGMVNEPMAAKRVDMKASVQ